VTKIFTSSMDLHWRQGQSMDLVLFPFSVELDQTHSCERI